MGYGALQLTTHAPQNAVLGQKLAFLGQKKRFFGDGGSGTPDHLLQVTAKHVFFESSTLRIWYGALPVTSQAAKTLF